MLAATRQWPSCTPTSTSWQPDRTPPVAIPGSPPTWQPAGRAMRTLPGSSRRSPVASVADTPGAAGGREVLAFDLYGTLVDPIAISGELGQVLGEPDAAEV